NTPNNDDGDADYENNASYQFADRPPMECYLTWSDGNKSIDFYLIGVHYKCCGDDSYNVNATGDETTRRHHASLLLTDYVTNSRSDDNVIILGDFNNVGAQTISNPTLSPFTDQNNFNSASLFRLTDLETLNGGSSGYSWQGWTSSFSAAHLDHIIINDEMFIYQDDGVVISLPDQTGISTTNISNRISDHQPVLWSFSP
ncbi:MAG: endonuclease/exonuclease/phosphatase family protein, partial [Candidatus Neomarinimicrobiota bacterium]